MRAFRIAQPKTVEELAALLAATKEKTSLLAGGTDLIDELKSGVAEPELVVDLQGIPGLAGIARDGGGLRIGAMTRIVELAEDASVGRDFPILREAALSLATPQLRNVGTVGGNLCQRPRCWYYRDPRVPCRKKGGFNCFAFQGRNKYHAIFGPGGCFIVFPSDLAPALISLGAEVTLGGAKGDKAVPLESFYALPSADVRKENVLEKGRFLKEIRVPPAKAAQKGAYVKLKERGTWDFALVSAAVSGVLAGKVFSEISIVMGGVAPVPWRLKKAEDALKGQRVTEALLAAAAEVSLQEASPLSENAYKKELVAAALKKAVRPLLS